MLFHRPLLPADAPRLADHLKRLDDGDRRLRFAGHASNEAIDRFVGGIDWLRSFHIATFEGAEIRGAASIIWRDPILPQAAELAVSVETAHQKQGVGSELVRRCLVAARNRGIVRVEMLCLAENARMRAIARRFHSMLTLVDGEASSRIALERADPWSFFEEAMEAGEALVAAAVELGAAWPGFVSGIDGRRSAA